jgi:hypothetical protein
VASTQVGIIRKADGTITQVISPDNDSQLDNVPLKTGETVTKVNRTIYNTFVSMQALATSLGLKVV